MNTDKIYRKDGGISQRLKNLVDPKNEYFCKYTLSNKCKHWATSISIGDSLYSYVIMSFVRSEGLYSEALVCSQYPTCTPDKRFPISEFCSHDEFEAIYQACEWIIEQESIGIKEKK